MFSSEESSTDQDILTLPTIFNQGLDLFNNLEKSDEPTNSLEVQVSVKKCIKLLEKATMLCSYADIFSNNESIEEVATSHLHYFLLPALLGSLHLKLTSGERKNIVEVSEIYFTDFMKRCVEYDLCQYEFKKKTAKELQICETNSENTLSEMEELTVLAKRRAVKISRYREQQELKKRLNELKDNMKNEHADEEIKRNYFLTMIQLYIFEAIEELNSLELEKLLLDHMSKLKKNETVKPRKRPLPTLRPVIITSDVSQQGACTAEYSSLCSMTVKEFCEKRVKDGLFPDMSKWNSNFKNLPPVPPQEPNESNELLCDELETDDYHIIEAMRQGNTKDLCFKEWRSRESMTQ